MAKLKEKIKTGLGESRILILGAQVLLGFQYRAVFEGGFDKLPPSSQYVKLCGLGLSLITIGLLMSPSAYHRIVVEGEDSWDMQRFTTDVMGLALLPFAVGLGLDMYVATGKLLGPTAGLVSAAVSCLVALFFWYGLEVWRRSERAPEIREEQMKSEREDAEEEGGAKIKDKIEHVLTEARMVLPGAQALLGFQLASMLVEGFDKLPSSSKYVHLASLALIALTAILLMTPAAYHRLVERGEDTEHFHRFASRLLIVSMIPLALGISGDLFVVVRKVTESAKGATIAAAVALLFFYGFWFGFTLYKRAQRNPLEQGAASMAG
jgi:amino acid permease